MRPDPATRLPEYLGGGGDRRPVGPRTAARPRRRPGPWQTAEQPDGRFAVDAGHGHDLIQELALLGAGRLPIPLPLHCGVSRRLARVTGLLGWIGNRERFLTLPGPTSRVGGDQRSRQRRRMPMRWLEQVDPEVAKAIRLETERQSRNLELIASENFVSEAVLEAVGSVMTNKYAEGYPGRRYYGGCENVDTVEELAVQRAKELFGAEHVNVQPHSGSQANMAAYFTVLSPGDTIVAPNLAHGGHLTMGKPDQLLGEALPDRAVRRPPRGRADRHGPGADALPRAPAEAPGDWRLRVPESDRLQGVPEDRRRGRVPHDGRHRASGRAGRGGSPPDPHPVRRLRDVDHAQDAPGTTGRHGHVPRGERPGARQGRDAGDAGRAADARHRGQGGRVPGGPHARLARVPAADRRQREGAGRLADAARVPAGDAAGRTPT